MDSINFLDEYIWNKICLNLLFLMKEINLLVKESIICIINYLNDVVILYN